MKNQPFHLFFAVPEKIVLDEDVADATLPGAAGYFEVLKDHAPIMATLTSGQVAITKKCGEKFTWTISKGYFEMSHNSAALLVESIENTTINA